ncbi:mannose-1-phosphate guanylyltransferase/mannose-6-phosphate isomerase [Paramaledivibacter caminithermalis]|jgi:mannose-1-phosphate guanylyltransferase/mannose-6-phosphate isomerase|uniref:mannose-1-phosphate guanylyltransferase n=1 Tax=Paramaledivibacter caminithermalis (strain DSM 15212 / CIP 107654 / DViRD3) TaxID=1121301 RepID=A0A1M6L5X7_PARC5|nr:mannose-1-phosphate guanylyltransferase/mannose-6-phosphate isomerase [Paramaledivibacter caminithermalis]SHJ66633.1 mannose-1-phosphate guanylyltransferase / mannose-6-phosphate isomerase [Paramaledivibacter caminithermalis DSM 15212]
MNIIALILAGGTGTRLWPLSRKNTPKQLLALTGNRTLIQETCRRLWTVVTPDKQWIITSKELYDSVKHHIRLLREEFHQDKSEEEYITVMQEPIGKNTAPAIFWAAQRCRHIYGEDSILLVMPSDHLIVGENEFIDTLKAGIEKAKEGFLVTYGIKPSHPETGYGYIKIENNKIKSKTPYKVLNFVEKPNYERAQKYIEEGNYLWNSGMFAFHVGTLIKEGLNLCPNISKPFNESDPFNSSQINNSYMKAEANSIDYAVMEKTDKALVIPASFGWNDVGTWKSFFDISDKDENGNVITGNHINIDTKNSFVYGQERLIATVGIEDMTVIDTPDALMICPLDQTQRVKEIVEKLKIENSKTHIEHKTVKRPWGKYTVMEEGLGYKIKKIVVEPGEKLSMQMHYHRSEHWIVVRGSAKITNGDKEIIIHENQSTYIPKATVHRLENPGSMSLEIIEVQCGLYLEEDDIVRFDDVYGRRSS